jgi:S-adenosylmethionine synthetase
MFEKVNPMHPDKIADRIAGALVDLAYKNTLNPKVALEVLIGHNECHIIGESSYDYNEDEINKILDRLVPYIKKRTYNIVK